MISSEAFVLSLGLVLGSLAAWAFKRLPDERSGYLSRFRRVFFPSSRARHPAGFAGRHRSSLAAGGGPFSRGVMGDSLCMVREKHGHWSRDFFSPASRSNFASGLVISPQLAAM
jgi:hypothetical protein